MPRYTEEELEEGQVSVNNNFIGVTYDLSPVFTELNSATVHIWATTHISRLWMTALHENRTCSTVYIVYLVCLYTVPVSIHLSEGRKLPQYWDTPARHIRPQHRDSRQGDKHQQRLCWCSSGPQLSTHLSEGHTCTHAVFTQLNEGLGQIYNKTSLF